MVRGWQLEQLALLPYERNTRQDVLPVQRRSCGEVIVGEPGVQLVRDTRFQRNSYETLNRISRAVLAH